MTLRDVKNWRVDDQFPGIAIESIPLLSDKLNSLYARAIDREHIQSSLRLSHISIQSEELMLGFTTYMLMRQKSPRFHNRFGTNTLHTVV